jgi:hypothetical protein
MVMEPVWRFVRAYAFHLGVLEGVPGLFVAATGAFYAFLRVAKVWEAAVAAPLTDEEASPRTLSPPLGGAP